MDEADVEQLSRVSVEMRDDVSPALKRRRWLRVTQEMAEHWLSDAEFVRKLMMWRPTGINFRRLYALACYRDDDDLMTLLSRYGTERDWHDEDINCPFCDSKMVGVECGGICVDCGRGLWLDHCRRCSSYDGLAAIETWTCASEVLFATAASPPLNRHEDYVYLPPYIRSTNSWNGRAFIDDSTRWYVKCPGCRKRTKLYCD